MDGSCKHKDYEIQIKNCDGYYVYYLKSTSGCASAYCFGNYNIKFNHGTSLWEIHLSINKYELSNQR